MQRIQQAVEPNKARYDGIARRLFKSEYTVLTLTLIAVIGIMSYVTGGLTTTRDNIRNIMFQISQLGVASVGQAFVIIQGGIDLSIGGIGEFCCLMGAIMWTRIPAVAMTVDGQFVPIYLVPLLMVLLATIWGTANGAAVSRIGMPPLIVTLAMWQITKGVSFPLSGGRIIYEFPREVAWLGQGSVGGVPIAAIVFIAVAIVAHMVLTYTPYGRAVHAVGGNSVSAWLSGINVTRIRFSVYVISALLVGLAGSVYTSRIMSASVQSMSGYELDTIAACCVGGISLSGGKGGIIGVVLGTLIFGVVRNGLSVLGADPTTQGIITGAIIFTAVAIDYIRKHREAS